MLGIVIFSKAAMHLLCKKVCVCDIRMKELVLGMCSLCHIQITELESDGFRIIINAGLPLKLVLGLCAVVLSSLLLPQQVAHGSVGALTLPCVTAIYVYICLSH